MMEGHRIGDETIQALGRGARMPKEGLVVGL